MPLGSGAAERLPVWIRTRPASADPTSIATLHDEAITQMAIALRLITLAFGPLLSPAERCYGAGDGEMAPSSLPYQLMERLMPQPNDLSRSLVALDQNS